LDLSYFFASTLRAPVSVLDSLVARHCALSPWLYWFTVLFFN